MRRHPTDAEGVLWRKLRDRQLGGVQFRRQHPVGPYIADFYCPERNLIVEVDGGQHVENQEADERRTKELEKLGYHVLRFWNHEVLNLSDAVLEKILQEIEIPHPSPLPSRERERENQIVLILKTRPFSAPLLSDEYQVGNQSLTLALSLRGQGK